MSVRIKRSIIFGIALGIGMSIADYISGNEISIIKLIAGGTVGGIVYFGVLKWQDR